MPLTTTTIPVVDDEIAVAKTGAGTNAALMRTAIKAVGYDSQSLTDAQKLQARINIGASGIANVIYATDYGVVADGETDDTDALQSAIDAAVPLAPAIVQLPAGIIGLTRTSQTGVGYPGDNDKHSILLYSNLTLRGVGRATILKLLDDCPDNTPVILAHAADTSGTNPLGASGSANIVVQDLVVDGNAVARETLIGNESEGINFKGATFCAIERCLIRDCGQDGIDLDASADCLVADCELRDIQGNGFHCAGGGSSSRHIVRGCSFFNCGHVRAAAGQATPTGAAVDLSPNQSACQVLDCSFFGNARAVFIQGGPAIMRRCYVKHDVSDYPAIHLMGPVASSNAEICDNLFFWANAQAAIKIDDTGSAQKTRAKICDNFFSHATTSQTAILATKSGRLRIYRNNFSAVQRALDATETTEPVEFSGNIVGSGAVNSLRIYASANGFARNNTFGGVNGGHIIMQTGSSGWEISDNNFASWTNAIDTSGGGTGTKILRNTGFAPMLIIRANCVIENNEIGNFTLQSQATGGVFANNNISGTISHSTVNYGSNTWRDNRGAGTNGVFSGTATLVNGTATVTTAAAYSGKRIRLYRQSSGASSAIGALAVGTIDPGVSFVINALANDAGPPAAVITETGDLSVILWEIEG